MSRDLPVHAPSYRLTPSQKGSSNFTRTIRCRSQEMPNGRKVLLQGLVFLAFFPYPAVVSFGNTLGLQFSDVLVPIIILLTLPMVLRARSTRAYFVLVIPILVSL